MHDAAIELSPRPFYYYFGGWGTILLTCPVGQLTYQCLLFRICVFNKEFHKNTIHDFLQGSEHKKTKNMHSIYWIY